MQTVCDKSSFKWSISTVHFSSTLFSSRWFSVDRYSVCHPFPKPEENMGKLRMNPPAAGVFKRPMWTFQISLFNLLPYSSP